MSEEQRNEETETEVEAHGQRVSGQRVSANDEPGDEVEAHGQRVSANDEPEDEVEGHVQKTSHPKYS
jgi:hypothetical protein